MDAQTSKQYSEWLQTEKFHYFFTGTYRYDSTINSSRRTLQRFFSAPANKPKFAFLCIEPGELYGRIHGHGLLRYPEGAIFHPGELIQSAWAERYGFAKVEIPRSQDDVTGYCIKYATKNLLQDTYLIL